jgi:cytidine deaminase
LSPAIDRDDAALLDQARGVLPNAHAPYSRFPVGAVLRGRSGRTYPGVNVENASLGLSLCAERNAIFSAVAAGEKAFDAIAIVTRAHDGPTPPCGACRQVMLEFCGDEFRILLSAMDTPGEIEEHVLGELVPRPFRQYEPGA